MASVDEVPHEDIAGLWHAPAFPEQFEQVPELAVDVAADGDWGRYGLNIGFLEEDGSDGVAEDFHVLFWEMLAVHQLGDPFVGVVRHRRRRRCCVV